MTSSDEEDLFNPVYGSVKDGYDYFVRVDPAQLLKTMAYCAQVIEPYQTLGSLSPIVLYESQRWCPWDEMLASVVQYPVNEQHFEKFREAEEKAIRSAFEAAKRDTNTLRNKSAAENLRQKINALQKADILLHPGKDRFLEPLPSEMDYAGYEVLAFAKDNFPMFQLARYVVANRRRDITTISSLPMRYLLDMLVKLDNNFANEDYVLYSSGLLFRDKEEMEIVRLREKVKGGGTYVRQEYAKAFKQRMFYLRLNARLPGIDNEIHPYKSDCGPLDESSNHMRQQFVNMCGTLLKKTNSGATVLANRDWSKPEEEYLPLCEFESVIRRQCLCTKEAVVKEMVSQSYITLSLGKTGGQVQTLLKNTFRFTIPRELDNHCCIGVKSVQFFTTLPGLLFLRFPRLDEPKIDFNRVTLEETIDLRSLSGFEQFDVTKYTLDGLFCFKSSRNAADGHYVCFPRVESWVRYEGESEKEREMTGYDWMEAFYECLFAVYIMNNK